MINQTFCCFEGFLVTVSMRLKQSLKIMFMYLVCKVLVAWTQKRKLNPSDRDLQGLNEVIPFAAND